MAWIDATTRFVCFDAVGTLLFPDPAPTRIYVAAAARHGLKITEEQVRTRLWEAFAEEEAVDRAAHWRVSEERERQRWQRIVAHSLNDARAAAACFDELWQHFATSAAWRVHSETSHVLNLLHARQVECGIASNFDARLLAILDDIPELAPLRQKCVVSSLIGFRKPSPEFFAAVVATAGCRPHEILFVGDDLRNDFDGAIAAGMKAVLFDPNGRFATMPRIAALHELL